MVTEYIGYSMDDLAYALDCMEQVTGVGKYCQVQLCSEEPPSPDAIEETYQAILNTGHTITYPEVYQDGLVFVTAFNIRRDVPYEEYQWALLASLIGTLAVPALIAFGIVKIEGITKSLIPILLIAGGVIITVAALARKPATVYFERGGRIPMLPSVVRDMPATIKTEFQKAHEIWDRTPKPSKEAVFAKLGYPKQEADSSWNELREDRKVWLVDYYKEKYPDEFKGLVPSKKQAYGMKSNPPSTVEHKGRVYGIENTFPTRIEAKEEAESLRDSGSKVLVTPWESGYAVYEWQPDLKAATEQKSWVKILGRGGTDLTPGSTVTLEEFQKANEKAKGLGLEQATSGIAHRRIIYGKSKEGDLDTTNPSEETQLSFSDESDLVEDIIFLSETEERSIKGDLVQSLQEEIKAQEDYKSRAELAEAAGDKETAEIYRHIIPEEKEHEVELTKRLHDFEDLDYLPDSPEFLAETIEHDGWRTKLDQAFTERIASLRK